ncbi:MAG: glycosyltransferase family 1 protein [Chloroflexota bacterium]|nr:glycosyltransferase family 1 protein [Chloroflexota bacterium]
MLIGIDASRAIVTRPTGTEVYSRRLIQSLLALESPHRFRLYFRSAPPTNAFAGAALSVIPFPRLWTHLRLSWEMVRRSPDALFVPAHVLPLIHPRASLVTVHDLGYLHFPGAHPWRQRLYLGLSTRWNARAAAHILVDSEATKADLVAHYDAPPEKVTVAYPGYDETLAPVRDLAEVEAVKARYSIAGDYFLYLGTLQPRKNLTRVVTAFAALKPGLFGISRGCGFGLPNLLGARREEPEQVRDSDTSSTQTPRDPKPEASLVLAGKRGWLYQDLFAQVRRMGLEGRVIFPGYVPDEDKAALLSGALAFVFPSLYEGFGLPVLEAQACGCPVVTSTTSSLPEVAGDAALLVDPEDTAGIAAGMQRIAADSVLRESLTGRGFANVRRFSWTGCAESVLSVIARFVV